jgi:hypothetical protein
LLGDTLKQLATLTVKNGLFGFSRGTHFQLHLFKQMQPSSVPAGITLLSQHDDKRRHVGDCSTMFQRFRGGATNEKKCRWS